MVIRLVPIFSNIWTPNTKLTKDDFTLAPVWVKLHNIPDVVYYEVGLILITTQIGHPIMLDSYTSTLCLKSWGHNSYARAFVEVSSKEALLNSLVVAIPYPNGSGHSLEKIDIEYEWKPPRCETCKVFYHNDDGCSKRVKQVVKDKALVDEEGFIEAYKKKVKVSFRVLIVRLMGFVFKSLKSRIIIGWLLSLRMEGHRNLTNRTQVLQWLM